MHSIIMLLSAKKRLIFIYCLLSIFYQYGFSSINTDKLDITVYKLINGINVILVPIKNTELVCFNILVKHNLNSNKNNKDGVANYLEHLMFINKGYEHKKIKFSKSNAVFFNAKTNFGWTTYISGASDKSKLIKLLEIDSIRFNKFSVDKDKAQKTLAVVKESLSFNNSDNDKLLLEESLKILYKNERLASIIGTKNSLNTMTLEDAESFFLDNYTTDNINIIIVGNIEPIGLAKSLEKFFGNIKNKKSIDINLSKKVTGDKRSYLEIHKNNKHADTQTVLAIWKDLPTPESNFDKYIAVNLLCAILNTESGALRKYFIEEKKMAYKISIKNLVLTENKSIISIKANLNKGVDVSEFENELSKFIAKTLEKGLDNTMFVSAQKELINNITYINEDIEKLCKSLTSLVSYGVDPKKYNEYTNIVNSMTPRFVNKVFSRYLSEKPNIISVIKKGE